MRFPCVAHIAPVLAAILATGPALAQGAPARAVAGIDPHTRGEPAAMAKLGYVAFGVDAVEVQRQWLRALLPP